MWPCGHQAVHHAEEVKEVQQYRRRLALGRRRSTFDLEEPPRPVYVLLVFIPRQMRRIA